MSAIQHYSTKKEAKEVISKMVGWDNPKAVEVYGTDAKGNLLKNEEGFAVKLWIIEVPRANPGADSMYLREDGLIN